MDENNLNSMPLGDEGKKDDAEVLPEETAAMAEETTTELLEEESDCEQSADASQENQCAEAEESSEEIATEETETAEAEEATQEPVKKKKTGKGAKIAIGILLTIMALAIAGTVAVFIAARPPKIDLDQTALSVSDVESNAAEFYQVYMYYYSYNSYYGYSDDELKDLAIDQLVFTNALYAEAVANGYTLTEEDQAAIDAQMSSVTATAETYSMSADEYLDENYCKGFTAEMFEDIVTKSQLAQRYYSDKMEALEKEYEDAAKVEALYKENKLDYDLADAQYCFFDASDENAVKNANQVVALINGGASFEDAVKQVAGDTESVNSLAGKTKAELESGSFDEDAIAWIFEEDADGNYVNAAGAVTTVETDSTVYVLYVNNAPSRNEALPVSAYYIQVDVSTDDSVKSASELKLEAKTTAETILKDFEATDKTAESFVDIVSEYYNGDNELVDGDVLEDMQNDGSQDAAIEEWAFAEGRAEGDYALVEGDGCYYILYVSEKSENPVWYETVLDDVITEEASSFETEMLETNKEIAVMNDDVINEVIAYVQETLASQYSY